MVAGLAFELVTKLRSNCLNRAMNPAQKLNLEDLTRVGDALWMAVRREWKDDPKNHIKLVAYNLDIKEWGTVRGSKEEPS